MNESINIHRVLLTDQLSCLFKFVNDNKIHRSKFSDFTPVFSEGQSVVRYQYNELNAGRGVNVISVDTEHRLFNFVQHYNYGVLLHVEVMTTDEDPNNPRYTLNDFLINHANDEEIIKNVMIDFEYALSLVTENISKQKIVQGN